MTAMHGPVSPFPEPPSERACAGGEVAEPALPDTAARDRAARVVADRAEGEAYVASVCFKHGPPRLVGVELEHLVYDRADPSARLAPDRLARALGSHAPATLARHPGRTPGPSSSELPAGSALTVEPGGQVEISTAPHPTLDRLISAATTDLDHVAALLAAEGLLLGRTAIDSTRTPARLLETERYAAMERRFAARGSGGITMMCSTAAVQVCLDAGEPADLPARWAALHAAGPVLLALFANSTHHAGRRTGQASARWLSVLDTDPPRTRFDAAPADPPAAWARRVLDTPLMVRRRARGRWDAPPAVPFADWIARRGIARTWPPPTFGDLDYHLTTLFPPVRPRGHLEVRYLDAQPPGRWIDPVAMLAALLHRPDVTDRVLDLCAPVGTGEDRWVHAARHGTADPDLNRVARQLVDLACGELGALGLSGDSVDDITAALHARLDREPAPRRPGEPGRPTPPPRTPRVPPPPGPLPQPRTPQTGPRPRQSADPSTTRRTTP